MNRAALIWFKTTEWKLLIIEPFFQQKLNKIKTENRVGIWWCCWKAVSESDLIEFYFTILGATISKALILEWVLLLKFQTNCKKIGFGREKNQLRTLNVFTLGPINRL
jgi:hypothetical protein